VIFDPVNFYRERGVFIKSIHPYSVQFQKLQNRPPPLRNDISPRHFYFPPGFKAVIISHLLCKRTRGVIFDSLKAGNFALLSFGFITSEFQGRGSAAVNRKIKGIRAIGLKFLKILPSKFSYYF